MLGVPNQYLRSSECFRGFESLVWSMMEWKGGEVKCDEERMIVLERCGMDSEWLKDDDGMKWKERRELAE